MRISEPEIPSFRAWNTQFQTLGTPSFKAWNTQFQTSGTPKLQKNDKRKQKYRQPHKLQSVISATPSTSDSANKAPKHHICAHNSHT